MAETPSQQVTREIRASVWPALEDAGFANHQGRTAWSETSEVFRLVCFQSVDAYSVRAIGCTTASFSVRVGAYYKAMDELPWSKPRRSPRPNEHECHARRSLTKGLDQRGKFQPFSGTGDAPAPFRRGLEGLRRAFGSGPPERRDIWFVEPDRGNVASAVGDAREQIVRSAVPWLTRLSDLDAALALFQADAGGSGDYLAGAPHSVARAEVITAIALRLGRPAVAADAWRTVLRNPAYANDTAHRALAGERLRALGAER